LVQTEVWGLEVEFEQVFSARQVQGALLRREAGALLQEIGDVVGGKGTIFQGIGQGACHRLLRVDVAQGNDLSHVMVRVEATLFELSGVEIGLG